MTRKFTAIIMAMLMFIPTAAFAQTGFTSTTSYNDLPVNYVKVDKLTMSGATLENASSNILKVNWPRESGTYTAIVYNGTASFGSANRTSTSDAVMANNTVSGSFNLRWTNAATLPDGTKADVVMMFSNWNFQLGKAPSSFNTNNKVNVPIIQGDSGALSFATYNPRSGTAVSTALATDIRQRVTTTVKIVNTGTNTPIDSKYSSFLVRFADLDVVDHSTSTGKTAAERYAGSYSEGVGLVSGWGSKLYRTAATLTVLDTVGGNTKVRGTHSDEGTINSGFIGSAAPQGYSYIWYGSVSNTMTEDNMATTIMTCPEVSVYASAGTGGTIQKKGATNYQLNGTTTYDYTPSRGYKVKSLTVNGSAVSFDPAGGTYTFAKLIERNASGYDHTIDVQFQGPKVTYQWDGEHPNKAVPAQQEVVPGEYTVDTTYKPGDTVDDENGTWTFLGWDKDPTIEVYEDTVIKGQWSYMNKWDITTEVVNGTITPSETRIPEGENRTVTYSPNDGYQLLSVTVDGQNVTDSPERYAFNNISSNHHVKVVYEKIPALEIEKKSDRTNYNAGDIVTYTVKVKQTVDGAEARGVTVTDSIPSGLTLVEGSIEGAEVVEQSPNAYKVSLGTLGEKTYTYKCKTAESIDAHGLVNTVTASGENVPNQVTDDNSVDSHVPVVTIDKRVDKEEAFRDNELTYTIDVEQIHRGAELRKAEFVDTIPEGITVDPESVQATNNVEATLEDGKIVARIPVLTDGFTVTFKATINQDTVGTILNSASVDGYITDEQKIPEPVEDNAQTVVIPPEMELIKTVDKESTYYNDELTYTITANQKVDGTYLKEAVIEDAIPDGAEYVEDSLEVVSEDESAAAVEDGVIKVSFEKLHRSATISFKVKVAARDGEILNTAFLKSPDIEDMSADANSVVVPPDLEITKKIDKKTAKKGEKVHYTITVKEKNGVPVYDAVLKDKLPEGVTLVQDSLKIDKADVTDKGFKAQVSFDKKLVVEYDATVDDYGKNMKNVATITYEGESKNAKAMVSCPKPDDPKPVQTGDDFNLWAVFALVAAVVGVRRAKNS